jgi:hypothetical protein
MEDNHPRNETAADRETAYKNLAKLVKKLVFQHGIDYPDGGLVFRIATRRNAEGKEIDLSRASGFDPEVGNIDATLITRMHDNKVLGKQTSYESDSGGPFRRMDLDGNELGLGKIDESRAAAVVLGTHLLAASKVPDLTQGIDGQPISAFEANTLREEIEASTPVPR